MSDARTRIYTDMKPAAEAVPQPKRRLFFRSGKADGGSPESRPRNKSTSSGNVKTHAIKSRVKPLNGVEENSGTAKPLGKSKKTREDSARGKVYTSSGNVNAETHVFKSRVKPLDGVEYNSGRSKPLGKSRFASVKAKKTGVDSAHGKGGRSTYPERLLRNTAIACAMLLAILAAKNLNLPWSNAAVKGIESALTMRIDLDESLGNLQFVRSIMPESSLVFFNISGSAPARPVTGDIIHPYTSAQPWLVYACDDGAEVISAMAGTVSAVTQLTGGDWCVLVDHGDGRETLYGYLDKPEVAQGDAVTRGQRLGNLRGEELFYEMRLSGESVDPQSGADL